MHPGKAEARRRPPPPRDPIWGAKGEQTTTTLRLWPCTQQFPVNLTELENKFILSGHGDSPFCVAQEVVEQEQTPRGNSPVNCS